MISIKRTLDNIAELLEEIIDGHCNPNSPAYNECELEQHQCQWCVEAREVLKRIKN